MPQVKDYNAIHSSRFTRLPEHPSVVEGPSIDIHTTGKLNEK